MKTEVLLPKVFNFSFTYNSNNIPLKTGDLVEIPFGQNTEIGVVWKKRNEELKKNIKIKKIIKKIENYSLDYKLVDFVEWFSSYNMVPLGLVLRMVLGNKDKFTKKVKENFIKLNKKKEKYKLNEEQKKAFKFIICYI
jgi:primosomal protein N' (replication factor Y)